MAMTRYGLQEAVTALFWDWVVFGPTGLEATRA
jgi:hypothetical protein